MTFATLLPSTFWTRFEEFCRSLAPSQTRAQTQESMEDDSGVERDFVLELLDRHPDAFQGEMDILNMARLYRSKY